MTERSIADQILTDMQDASDRVDEAHGTSDYQARLVALALIARHFLREVGSRPDPAPLTCDSCQQLYEVGMCRRCWETELLGPDPAPWQEVRQHGRDCPKVAHVGGEGYLHGAEDDRPYDVDGVTYCGRCHRWMGSALPVSPERPV